MKSLKSKRRIAVLGVFLLSITTMIPVYAAQEVFKTLPTNWMQIGIIIGSLILFFGLICTGIALLSKRRNKHAVQKNSDQGMKLDAFIMEWGGRIPYEIAIEIVTPVLKQLASAHSRGLCHLDICPDRILIKNTTQGYLLPPRSAREKNQLILDASFSAPEQLNAHATLDSWTDVYSFCAILYYMITGAKPQGVLQRRLESDSFPKVLEKSGISTKVQSIIESGLSVASSLRPVNALELLQAFKIEFTPKKDAYKQKKRANPVKVRKIIRFVTSTLLALIVLPLAYLGGWKIIEYHYNNAITYVDAEKFDTAYAQWRRVPLTYKDSAQLGQYICANIEIGYKNFDSAKIRFEQLGNYRNSVDMLQEVDYQEALYALEELDFSTARKMFQDLYEYKDCKAKLLEVDYQQALEYLSKQEYKTAENLFQVLADKKYSDSEAQVKEVCYRWAQLYYENGLYAAAISKMESIEDYKDSSSLRKQMVASIYKKGIEAYRRSEVATAFDCFDAIKTFGNSESYLTLLEAKSTDFLDLNENYESTKLLFNRLQQIDFFEDAKELLVNDVFIYYKLEGYWKEGSNYISLKHKKDGWLMTHTMPGFITNGSFDLANGAVYFGNVDKGWQKVFDLIFDSDDQLTLFCLKNKKTYHLERK